MSIDLHIHSSNSDGTDKIEDILNIALKLKTASMLRKLGLSLQSLNFDVLTNVKRKNMELNNLSNILKQAKERDLEVMVEMILNLPGETKETWIENYCNLLSNDNIFIDSYPLTVLKNSELGKQEYLQENLKNKAKGIDNRPVDPSPWIAKQQGTETTFESDIKEEKEVDLALSELSISSTKSVSSSYSIPLFICLACPSSLNFKD